MLIDLKIVANEIKEVGLYDFILQDCIKILDKDSISKEEILSLLHSNPDILETYKKTNTENNISNIHFDNLNEDINVDKKNMVQKINKNLNKLRNIEKYTLSFEESPTLVFVFSIEFFVLFSAQYFIVLLGLKDWQIEIYGMFALSILVAWIYSKKQKEKYILNNEEFNNLYPKTEKLINSFLVNN